MKRLLILFIIVVGSFGVANAQSFDEDEKEKKDSVLYHNIYEQSKHNRFNKFIYDQVFRKPQNTSKDSLVKSSLVHTYKGFERKIIRKIIITNEDPFYINDEDSSVVIKNLSRTANFLHTNTQPFVIKSLLLFKENQVFDTLLVQESERLIRSQSYIEKSSISAVRVENTNDSIDIIVTVKDKFSIYPEAEISSSRFGFGLKEINLFGMGHRPRIYYSWNYPGEIHNYQYSYGIPNIFNTYISSNILYQKNRTDGNETKQLSAERPFYSPLAKWAGGINIMQESQKYDINIPNTNEFTIQEFKYNVLDFWGAYAFDIKSKKPIEARTRKLVLSARYYHIDYPESPSPEYDPSNMYSMENLYLISIGISKRIYKKDYYLFRYGFTEDVPTGYNFSFISGIQHKNDRNRLYLATKLSMGNYFKLGYLNGSLQHGSFFDRLNIEEGVFTVEMNYFTPLLKAGGWKFRQFVKIQYLAGINRLKTDRLYLQDYFGINGFNANSITGTQKFICNFQTQVFTPWNLLGFKFAPYFIYSMGMLGDYENGFRKSRVYSLFGIGFLIRNDYLVFNTFQISVSFYPYIPGQGHNIFKFNAYEASDFKFIDFDSKKPEQVIYR
ncbi:MAG: hypothetical protein LBQ22_03550 [Bacteroidales bacterium]|jgi:hypothetical protein|nr:hypothetical protein [Bacteroidales bacterium]